ncbi:hypothetical protein RirG_095360 [Rhizophagus irregularis DAOM 197198w]|uniref:Uncharacterized protein n=1 Tax=Rhizophagus irregularis (strain DAOM 197198w) TaxID=1432141 RepID=A0A015JQF1_RHIIW|nr:hypothetical protein RirG_095360 [Rhizophagus irregularis DAOM 197198w]
MRKNLKLILILIIATFSNFTFAKVPLKWRREELFGALHGYVGILSNHSSLVERQAVCPFGNFECPAKNGCCPIGQTCASGDLCSDCGPNPVVCDNTHCCEPGFQCCKKGCCKIGLICATDDDIGICKEVDTEDSEEDTLPCGLTKTAKIKTKTYRNKAENASFAYIYDSTTGSLTQMILTDAINRDEVQADHVFEAQTVIKYLKGDGSKICSFITSNSAYLDELKEIMNDEANIRYLSTIINRAKGTYFGGNNVDDTKVLNAVKEYLAIDDIYEAFSTTRNKVIKLFRKIVSENGLDVHNFANIENSLGRTEYESLTKKSLVTDSSSDTPPSPLPLPNKSFNNSSSTLPLPHLNVILSVILSLVFLVFGECGQKITRMSISHITKK